MVLLICVPTLSQMFPKIWNLTQEFLDIYSRCLNISLEKTPIKCQFSVKFLFSLNLDHIRP